MLSKKLRDYLIDEGVFDDSLDLNYQNAIESLGIKLESEFAYFNINTTEITFLSRYYELYNICWFIINTNYSEDIQYLQNSLGLTADYLPLDTFEAEHGFFYNKETGEVIELELGECLNNFHKGIIDKKWDTFNAFLEWYFRLE